MRATVVALVIMTTASCDSLTNQVCGELSGKRKQYADTLNEAYASHLHAEQVPCYPNYLQVNCLSAVSAKTLDSVELSARQFDWDEVLVYDQQKALIRGDIGSM